MNIKKVTTIIAAAILATICCVASSNASVTNHSPVKGVDPYSYKVTSNLSYYFGGVVTAAEKDLIQQ